MNLSSSEKLGIVRELRKMGYGGSFIDSIKEIEKNLVNERPTDPPIVKQRRGTRKNPDGSESSHLMMAEYIPERGWVAFPSLFQDSKPYADDSENWVDMSEEEDWMKIYEEAKGRGEVYDFGENKEAALAFGEGSWKDQYNGPLGNHNSEKTGKNNPNKRK